MARMRRYGFLLLIGVLAGASSAALATVCPFCSMQGQTLTDEVVQASLVVYGTLQNPKPSADDPGRGTTELVIDTVIKEHPILKERVQTVDGKKILKLDSLVPADRENKYKYIIFCDVFKGQIDPYRGVQVLPESNAAKYFQGAVGLLDKDVPSRLRFFFNFLDNIDVEISNDAYKEFANADYKDVLAISKDLPAETLAGWLKDPKTPAFRYGLYASLLGHSGKEEHAKLLRSMLDDPEKRAVSGVDGILAGYTMLKPKEGWTYLRGLLKDRSLDFALRYAALRAVRFFWDYRPDLVSKKDMVEAINVLLDQEDIADLAIEDLRKWEQWDLASRVLELSNRKSHSERIIQRSILRYALACPPAASPQAAEYVKQMRAKDPQMVMDAEELLKLEATPPPPPPKANKKDG